MSEYSELTAKIEALEKRVKYLEDTFATLADMSKSGEMGRYIAQRQCALAASKLVNAAAGTQKLNADAQQQVIYQLAAEKAAMDARIEEAIRNSMQNIPIMDDLEEQFTYRMVSDEEIEIRGFSGFNTSGELVIPEKIHGKSVIYIGKHAFFRTDFEKVYFPKSVMSIGEFAYFNRKNEITACFGAGNPALLKLKQIDVLVQDILIITSDGIHDYVSLDEMEDMYCDTADKGEFCQKIIDAAVKNGSVDDMSVIICVKESRG